MGVKSECLIPSLAAAHKLLDKDGASNSGSYRNASMIQFSRIGPFKRMPARSWMGLDEKSVKAFPCCSIHHLIDKFTFSWRVELLLLIN